MVDGAVALSGDDSNLAKALADAKSLLEKAQTSSTTIAAAISKVEQINKR
jgi:F-type H+-transporting ATPase subunit epsilon